MSSPRAVLAARVCDPGRLLAPRLRAVLDKFFADAESAQQALAAAFATIAISTTPIAASLAAFAVSTTTVTPTMILDSRPTLTRAEARSVYDGFAVKGHAGGRDASSGYGGPAVQALLAMAAFADARSVDR